MYADLCALYCHRKTGDAGIIYLWEQIQNYSSYLNIPSASLKLSLK